MVGKSGWMCMSDQTMPMCVKINGKVWGFPVRGKLGQTTNNPLQIFQSKARLGREATSRGQVHENQGGADNMGGVRRRLATSEKEGF